MTSAVGAVQPRALALSGVEEAVEVVLADDEVLVASESVEADWVDVDELPSSCGDELSVD